MPDAASVVRIVVVLLLAVSIGGTATVFRLYLTAWRMLPRRAGLTPLHVVLVSAGVLLIQGGLAWALIESIGRLSQPWQTVARLGMYGSGSALIIAALGVMALRQRQRRVHFRRHLSRLDDEGRSVSAVEAESVTADIDDDGAT